jgi:phage tail-like protein
VSGTVGTGFRFELTIDGVEVGAFTGCEGLSAEYDVTTYREGGANDFEHRLPGALRFTPIKLTRGVDSSTTSGSLATWFSTLRTNGGRTSAAKTASITAYAPDGAAIASWNLVGAYPVRWTGPAFSSDGYVVASETLELAHQGFID